ncbi:hypothetical protein GCM10010284_17070 [Streptomyces rubiginosohelvolus]|nr:hypothetical protein GCM10010284_17070 [Streptomyces rubiginosohelvolus]
MTDSDTAAEIEITADLVRDLLREQHPDLAELAVREVEGGWDNQQWRLGDELAVRMPRTERAPELQRKSAGGCPTSLRVCRSPSRARCGWGSRPHASRSGGRS